MLHQSKIRKTALSLIYAIVEQNATETDFSYDLFWEIALEKELDHYRQALAKAVLHACRAANEVGGSFIERAETFIQETEGDYTQIAQREATEPCIERTKALLIALKELNYSLHDKRRDGTKALEASGRKAIVQAATLKEMSDSLLLKYEDSPTPATDSVAAALRRWVRVLSECSTLGNPLALGESGEYAGLGKRARILDALRPEAEELARETLAHRSEWEDMLARLLRNYVPERLDAVDKSILYLSLYELQCRKLKAPIVISEAINLAHEYSGAKSAPFIHGILATAALENPENA